MSNKALLIFSGTSNTKLHVSSGFTVALMKSSDSEDYFLYDSHERDSFGMPTENGSAIMLVFTSIIALKNQIRSLATCLKLDQYEITSIEISKFPPQATSLDGHVSKKRKVIVEYVDKLINHDKTKIPNKQNYCKTLPHSITTDNKLPKGETETDGIPKDKNYNFCPPLKRKGIRKKHTSSSVDPDFILTGMPLNDDTDSTITSTGSLSNSLSLFSQGSNAEIIEKSAYLSESDSVRYGEIHEQQLELKNMKKFHKSFKFTIYQCKICCEAWPLKSTPKIVESYVCSRCSWDKKLPSKFSKENQMVPCKLPPELK